MLRDKAKLAGNLQKMDNMEVNYEDNNIIIEPVKKEIVYIPYYDTRTVYGTWYWSSYPPVHWQPAHRVHVTHYNPFYWHTGVHISFNYFFSSFHWQNRHVLVINPHRSHHYRPRHAISSQGYAKRWVHQPVHRRGAAYKSNVTRKKYANHKSYGYKNVVNKKNEHKLRSYQARKTVTHQGQAKSTLSKNKSFSSNNNKRNVKVNRADKQVVVPKKQTDIRHVKSVKSTNIQGVNPKKNSAILQNRPTHSVLGGSARNTPAILQNRPTHSVLGGSARNTPAILQNRPTHGVLGGSARKIQTVRKARLHHSAVKTQRHSVNKARHTKRN